MALVDAPPCLRDVESDQEALAAHEGDAVARDREAVGDAGQAACEGRRARGLPPTAAREERKDERRKGRGDDLDLARAREAGEKTRGRRRPRARAREPALGVAHVSTMPASAAAVQERPGAARRTRRRPRRMR